MNTEIPNTHLAITVAGEDQTGLIDKLAGKVSECGCNIEESRMAVLGTQCALIMLVSGPWNALSRLEGQLDPLGEKLGLTITHKRTHRRETGQAALPYRVEVITVDQPGIVRSIAAFFARNHINIEELVTGTDPAPHTGTATCTITMTVGIPATVHISTLREDFLDYCDNLNLDAIFEPVRG